MSSPQQQWDPSQPPVPGYAPPQPPKERSWFARHKFLTALLALVLIAGIGSALSGGDDAPTPAGVSAGAESGDDEPSGADEPSVEEPSAVEEPSVEVAPAAAAVGSKVRDGEFEFTVTKVDRGVPAVGGEFLREKAQGQFLLVHVTVENIGAEPQTLVDSVQKVRDDQGREFATDTVAAMVIEGNDVFFNEINPGNIVQGVLVYDMPKGAKPASIELHDSMFSGGVTVSLS